MADKTINNSTWGGPIKLADSGDGTYRVAAALGSEQVPGSAVPGRAVLLGASDGTNLQGLQVVSATYPQLKVSVFSNNSTNSLDISNTSDAITGISNGLKVSGLSYGFNGSTWDRLRYANVSKQGNPTAAGDNAIWTPTAGKKFRMLGLVMQCGATATSVFLKDGSTQISPTFYLTANQWADISSFFDRSNGILTAAANNLLNLNLSAANPVAVWVCGTEE